MTIISEKGRIAVKCERCQKDIPLQHGFGTSSLVLKTRTNGEIILSPLCDECATDITSVINHWLNKKEDKKSLKVLLERFKQEPKWTPVSEGLPEEKHYCLCCDKDRYMTIGFISKSKEWCFDDDEIDIDVVAWMPLPKPYEPQESESKRYAELSKSYVQGLHDGLAESEE